MDGWMDEGTNMEVGEGRRRPEGDQRESNKTKREVVVVWLLGERQSNAT